MRYRHVIVGAGAAGASAVEGIRAHDPDGAILLLTRENHPAYKRPALSRDLWFGGISKVQLSLHDADFYRQHGVELSLRREVVELDPERRTVWDDRGVAYEYDRLLLATGGKPRVLAVEGARSEGVRYFRSLEDYLLLESKLDRLQHALVLGGGFLAVELAAALRHAGKDVTFAYPRDYPLQSILPRDLGLFVAEYYRSRGIETLSNEAVAAFEEQSGLIVARTRQGNSITTQLALVGAGIEPHVELAEAAGLAVGNGIEVDEYARTSDSRIYAAGDVAEFPCLPLGLRMRSEHWEHALAHGRCAGANMAGADEPYTTLPRLYSGFFDLNWEGVGELDSRLAVDAAWKERFRTGALFYHREETIRGVLLWNLEGKLDRARALVQEGRSLTPEARAEIVDS